MLNTRKDVLNVAVSVEIGASPQSVSLPRLSILNGLSRLHDCESDPDADVATEASY